MSAATTSETSAPSERHLRADAQRNRDKILAAAEVAFRDQGSAVQMDDVARRAAVGVGTLYRHFPTKEALVAELANHRFSGCIDDAEAALGTVDAWAAIECFVYSNAEQMASDAGLRDTLALAGRDDSVCAVQRGVLEQRLRTLIARAHADRSVRDDVGVEDVQALMRGLAAAIAGGGDWRRLASVILGGLRATSGVTSPAELGVAGPGIARNRDRP